DSTNNRWGQARRRAPRSPDERLHGGGSPETTTMKDTRDEHAEKVALFRYGLIADILQPASAEDGRKLYERLKEKAAKTYCIPASRRTTVAVETLRDWLSLYKAGGFDALKPKPRKDIGSARDPDGGDRPARLDKGRAPRLLGVDGHRRGEEAERRGAID